MKDRIYLDNNATTAVDPSVIQKMVEELQTHYGNPSSIHHLGQDSRNRLVQARDYIAAFFKVKPKEVIFTSSATEALNMVIRGILGLSKGHVITSNGEHVAVYQTIKALEETSSCQVTYLPIGLWGAVQAEAVLHAIQPNTKLIALMAVNNETGVKTDIAAIAAIAKEKNIPLLVDGVALVGKEPFTLPQGVSAFCFSGHKIHGPKGIGCAIVRSHLKFAPLITGGEQEFGKRGGTENMVGIIGLAQAMRLVQETLPQAAEEMLRRRQMLENSILKEIPNSMINGEGPRISNTVNISFDGMEGESLLRQLDQAGIAVSHGSACSSGALEPSRVLLNMGLSMQKAKASIRFSLSRWTTDAEIEQCVKVIKGQRTKRT